MPPFHLMHHLEKKRRKYSHDPQSLETVLNIVVVCKINMTKVENISLIFLQFEVYLNETFREPSKMFNCHK